MIDRQASEWWLELLLSCRAPDRVWPLTPPHSCFRANELNLYSHRGWHPQSSSLNCPARSHLNCAINYHFQTRWSFLPAALIPLLIYFFLFQFWDEPWWDWEFLRYQRSRDSQTDGCSYNSQHQPFLLVCLQQRLHHQLSRVSGWYGWWLFPVGLCVCVCAQQRRKVHSCFPFLLTAVSLYNPLPLAGPCGDPLGCFVREAFPYLFTSTSSLRLLPDLLVAAYDNWVLSTPASLHHKAGDVRARGPRWWCVGQLP